MIVGQCCITWNLRERDDGEAKRDLDLIFKATCLIFVHFSQIHGLEKYQISKYEK